MALKKVNPVSPGRRTQVYSTFDEISRSTPEKNLLRGLNKSGGRNNNGRITAWHRGGGHKRHYRLIDFKRDKTGIPARVASIEYDPNRSVRIALLHYADGEKRYILAPLNLKVGTTVVSGPDADIQPGNTLPMVNIPLGTLIHNIELQPGKGGQIVRSAGTFAQLMAKEDPYALVKLPSGEVRMVLINCKATIGQLGNVEHENITLGKAGRRRWMGIKPLTRGVAKNPVDHPHGGGEGRTSGGRHPVTPWGKPTKGARTRKNKQTDKMIIRSRHAKKKR